MNKKLWKASNKLIINGVIFMVQCGKERTNWIRCLFNPHSCHSARRACQELQNPLPQFAKKNLLPGEKVPARADEGYEKCSSPALTHRLRLLPPLSRRARANYSIMDSATSPSAPRRMTGWEAYCEE